VGFADIRINAVAVIRGVNDRARGLRRPLLAPNGWLPRFIELMPVGGLDFQAASRRVPTETIAELPWRGLSCGRNLGGYATALPRGPAEY
jgi:molybdenum cofactor biosynthesis enzyme MoaA